MISLSAAHATTVSTPPVGHLGRSQDLAASLSELESARFLAPFRRIQWLLLEKVVAGRIAVEKMKFAVAMSNKSKY